MAGIVGLHDVSLMLLSFCIAWFSSYTALDTGERVTHSQGQTKYLWMVTAAFCLGSGIWAMHFIALMAYKAEVAITYDLNLTVLSLVVALVGTLIGFFIVSQSQSYYAILVSGIVMGLSIVSMHYMGMSAMNMPATLDYAYDLVLASIFIAVIASTLAMWLAFNTVGFKKKLLASFVMGIAIAGMHHTAMEAVILYGTSGICNVTQDAGIYQVNLAITVGVLVGFILISSLITSIFDRRFAFLAKKESVKLIENERKFRDLFRETPLPIHIVNRTGTIQDISNSWLKLLEYSRGEVLGHVITEFMTNDSTLSYETRMNGITPNHLNEYQFVKKSGMKVDVLVSSALRRDSTGSFIGAQEGLVDITNRKVSENALRQRQKMEALGELVGGVSHDFNNLLMIISGSLDIIKSKPEQFNSRLHTIQETVQRGQQLTRRLLTFSRKQPSASSFIDLRLFLPDMKEMLQRTLGSNVLVNIDVKSEIYLVEVDQAELELTIVNLCLNARDAMQGKGFITIQATNEHLPNDQVSNLRGQYIKLSVIDNGTGIDSKELPRVFEPFYTTKKQGKELGSGLGLTQVYGFATVQNNGSVIINSKVGSGTMVNLYLPSVVVSHTASSVVPNAISTKLIDGEGRKVLLVEDEPQVGEIIEALFKQLNFTTVVASNAADAKAILEHTEVFAVFTDIDMPGDINGIQLAQFIHANHKNIFIGLISGYNEPSDAIIDTSFPILKKPFTITSLAQFIRIALE